MHLSAWNNSAERMTILGMMMIKDFLGHNDVLGKFSWLIWWWAMLPLEDPYRMISWHQAHNAWLSWLTLWIKPPIHPSMLQITQSFSRVKVTFVWTFSSSHFQFHLFFIVASTSVTVAFSPCNSLRNIFASCVNYWWKMAMKRMSRLASHIACYHSWSTQAKRKSSIWG